jgi:hypothetical protein
LIPVEHVIIQEYQGRYFVAQAVTDALPPVFELIPSDEAKLEIHRADQPH